MSRIVPHCPDLVSYLAVVSERPREVAPVLAWSRATVIPAPSFVARPRRVRRALAAFFKSAARLVGSLALIGFGLLLIWFHVVWLWHPEAVLMRHYAIAPNVT